MAFDFNAASARAKQDAESTALEAMMLAPSGGGKSYRAGTFGCRTVYLYSGGESHGVRAAKQEASGKLFPIRYDFDCVEMIDGKQVINYDKVYQNLLDALTSPDLAKIKPEAVYVDGASEIEFTIRNSTKWKELCKTAKDKHNTFEEPKATVMMFRPIIEAMKNLQYQYGSHLAMSLIVDVKEYGPSGEIVECQPRILGYGVAEALIQQFGDTLVVSKMTDLKSGKSARRFQFMTDVVKTAKEESGAVKKSINFSPRISGVKTLPVHMDASFAEVIKLKQKGE